MTTPLLGKILQPFSATDEPSPQKQCDDLTDGTTNIRRTLTNLEANAYGIREGKEDRNPKPDRSVSGPVPILKPRQSCSSSARAPSLTAAQEESAMFAST
ncbi:hypothetical protein KIN20_013807 [Parelaphostrongylus tenuis]|uniref:Uncharacterized protein n=1 Tax=Parelaphostrongylus tenuis TaxID=148309 RepID=A0AAD5MCN1_PARTN|nr:hypothetical protein KIN20_013807 [Parelaphostrongylus tenuis]